ncbi:hypothetical protein RRG08_058240 [Elysia crispata]|uniref:Uncharacterized protein n=1 Tax=Elysia crispata TaxID=231223 RepID=A0AAE1AKM5_9GAST|nr:hypothetical protein RRG08_058240 [Elysia crispata]
MTASDDTMVGNHMYGSSAGICEKDGCVEKLHRAELSLYSPRVEVIVSVSESTGSLVWRGGKMSSGSRCQPWLGAVGENLCGKIKNRATRGRHSTAEIS